MSLFKNFILYLLLLLSLQSELIAFDNSANTTDSNNNCPGESIILPSAKPSIFVAEGNLHTDSGDWRDRYKFIAPFDGSIKISLNSTQKTDLDFKLSARRCNYEDLKIYADSNTNSKTFTFNAQANHTYYLTIFDNEWRGKSNPYNLKIEYLDDSNSDNNTSVIDGNLIDKEMPFYVVNSQESRYIRGDYIVLGSSVECLSTKKNSELLKSNRYCADKTYADGKSIATYIDTDSDANTWNSSSSSFTIPNNSKILWAGLFWQANLNNIKEQHSGKFWKIQRRAKPNNKQDIHAGWSWVSNSGEEFNIENTTAKNVLLKIDNNSSYKQVSAETLIANNNYYSKALGGAYGAFADITKLVNSSKISSGEHTITVANIAASQGMDGGNLGNYASWSVAIVYENSKDSLKKISIYNGFSTPKQEAKKITIDGFKLPVNQRVDSSLSLFSTKRVKGVKIDNTQVPLDAKSNLNSVVNRYDISDSVSRLRDKNTLDLTIASSREDLNSSSKLFVSMFAFSTKLYVPTLCYDYDLKIDDTYSIPSSNRAFSATALANSPLRVKIMLKSKESNLDMLDTKMQINFTPNDTFSYIRNMSQTTDPNTYSYHNAVDTNMQNSDLPNSEIAIGEDATQEGGKLPANSSVYSKLYYKFNKSQFNGKFNLFVDTKVAYDGVNKVAYRLSTNEQYSADYKINRCSTNPTYDAVYGMFNIERGDSTFSQNEEDRYSLYTQVVGVPFEVSVAAYKQDATGEYRAFEDSNAVVELELIDASSFENNSSLGFDSTCKDPDSYNIGKLVKFNNSSRVKVKIPDDFPTINNKTTYPSSLALKNAAFRVWVLAKDVNGTKEVVSHNCLSQSDSSCFEKVYKDNYSKSNRCFSACSNSSDSSCYNCLRKNFALPVCSRDNFAIRPESFHIVVGDNNETHSKVKVNIADNSSLKEANLAAGYLYSLDINATKYSSKNSKALGYYLNVQGSSKAKEAVAKFSDLASCANRANSALSINITNGQSASKPLKDAPSNTNSLILNNSGRYKIHIEDSEWTKVDQKGYKYKPFKNHSDCKAGSSEIYSSNLNAKRGCTTSSSSSLYKDLNLKMHPYSFDISSINAKSSPNASANYLYINSLEQTKQSIKESLAMALNIKGSIKAIGKNGVILTNYTKNCSANDLSISLDYNTQKAGVDSKIKDILGNELQLQYSLYTPGIDSIVSVKNVSDKKIDINFKKNYFKAIKEQLGSAKFNSYFNYKRAYNAAVNPFDLKFSKLKISGYQDRSSVDLKANYTPQAQKDLNSSKVMYYAKAKPQSEFYDDIYTKIVKTPVMVALFCNEELEYCEKYGIDSTKEATSEYDWWIAAKHSAALKEGIVELTVNDSSKVEVYPEVIDSFINGVNKEVTVEDKGISKKPYTATISPSSSMKEHYPWLLFNKKENIAPAYLYKVKFVDRPSAWSGKGKTGHIINSDSSGRKSQKIDW